MESAIQRIKSTIFSINSHLLKLKISYFLLYASMFAAMPYISIISTKIISYQQLSVLFICATLVSTAGPIITGFLADKLGIYKAIIITGSFFMGFAHLPVLWLESVHRSQSHVVEHNESIQLAAGGSSAVQLPSTNSVLPSEYLFPILLLVRIAGFIGMDAALVLLDAAGLAMTTKHGGDFGKQKMWSTMSMVIVPTLCGLLIDAISEKLGYTDYSIAFYIAAAFIVILIPIMAKMEIQVHKNDQSIIETAKKVIGMIDVDVFLFVQILVGVCMGFHLTFLSVYVDAELNASKTLYGMAFSCSGISAMISLSVAKPMIDRFGEANTVAFGLMLYSIRFTIFHFLQNPWIIIATESLDGFSGFLSFTTGSYFCAAAAPPGMLASLNGILAAATFGVGRGFGTSVGSFLISAHGIRSTYLFFGILAGSTSILYCVAYHLALKKMERKRLTAQPEQGSVEGVSNLAVDLNNDIEITKL